MDKEVKFGDLNGKTIINIIQKRSEEILFGCTDYSIYRMFHEQECCEDVYIDDICGDMEDLLGTPILLAEMVSNSSGEEVNTDYDYYTWTFYKLSTIKGSVTIKWYGSSNGYYSEEVSFKLVSP